MTHPDDGLTTNMRAVLHALTTAGAAVTGRRLAGSTSLAPGTVNSALKALEQRGLVTSTRSGAAVLWAVQAGRPASLDLPVFDSNDAAAWNVSVETSRTVLIVTALPLEFRAVRGHLSVAVPARTNNGTRLIDGTYSGQQVVWRVLVAQSGMGNSPAAAMASQIAAEYNVDLIGFVGVGGGLKPADQARGDVVAVQAAFDGHAAKHHQTDGESHVSARPRSYDTPFALQQLALAVARGDWNAGLDADRDTGQPEATLDAAVCTQAVLADVDDHFLAWIAEHVNHAKVVDMETLGVYAGAHSAGVPAISVRGISDLIGGKTAGADDRWQPVAARNAAEFFFRLLDEADPEDVPPSRGRTSPPEHPIRFEDAPERFADWFNALNTQSTEAAQDAAHDLSTRGEPIATYVNKIVHRPPSWLRRDTTGVAWWLVAHLADGASTKSRTAYDRAAEAAREASRPADAATYELFGVLSKSGVDTTDDVAARQAMTDCLAQLEALSLRTAPGMRDVIAFWVAYLTAARTGTDADAEGDADRDLEMRAATALTALGGDPTTITSQPAPAPSATVQGLNDLARAHNIGRIHIAMASKWLADDNPRALPAVDAALAMLPQSLNARLLRAHAMLLPLIPISRAAGSSVGTVDDASVTYDRITTEALAVRAARRDWGGDTAEPLALAIRARSMSGDVTTAIRLGRASPNGTATDTEANDAGVRHAVAVAALLAGDAQLALKMAEGMPAGIETDLMRATAFEHGVNLDGEARELYRSVATNSDARIDQLTRALFGLARLGASSDPSIEDNFSEPLARLRAKCPEDADMIAAHEHMNQGRPRDVLTLTRRYPNSDMALYLQSEALASDGDPDAAVDLLLSAADRRTDDEMRAAALRIASRHDMEDRVSAIANTLTSSVVPQIRRRANATLADVAAIRSNWAAMRRHVIAAMSTLRDDPSADIADYAHFRWMLVQAEYNDGRFDRAASTLWTVEHQGATVTAPLEADTAQRAAMTFVIVKTAHDHGGLGSLTAAQFDWLITVAATWAGDENVFSRAMVCMMTVPVQKPTDVQLAKSRAMQEDYFRRYDDDGSIKRIKLDENLEQLQEFIKTTWSKNAQTIDEYAAKARLGQIPVAVVCEMAKVSYAEHLVQSAADVQVISGEPEQIQQHQRDAARAALGARVAIDTSALALVNSSSLTLADLAPHLKSAMLAAELRFDVVNARASLDLKSPGKIGWDSAADSIAIHTYPDDLVDQWAVSGRALADSLQYVDVPPRIITEDGRLWSASLTLAAEHRVPLWADDVSLRAVARGQNIATFGTVDLVHVLVETGAISSAAVAEFSASLRCARAVDFPLGQAWDQAASAEGWDTSGYTALTISRPAAWADVHEGIREYQGLIRSLVRAGGDGDDRVMRWSFWAALGLAWATPPPNRPRVVAALLAWTVLHDQIATVSNTKPDDEAIRGIAVRLSVMIKVGKELQALTFPAGDAVGNIVTVLADLLHSGLSAAAAAQTLARVFSYLPAAQKDEAWRRYLDTSQA